MQDATRLLAILAGTHVEPPILFIRSMAWQVPILSRADTFEPAGEFIRAVFPHLDREERERVERAVLAVPGVVPEERAEAGERIRKFLLGCIAAEDLVTGVAGQMRAALEAAGQLAEGRPRGRARAFWSPDVSDMSRGGARVDENKASREIRRLLEPVEAFARKHSGSTVTRELALDSLPALRELHRALTERKPESASQQVVQQADSR